ncbi:zinc finger protein OZF-like [Condylostylus longicornis]|uniref:zinc finger protein OZF-like n=1 Tax=Condylostylus longicornis TaxID=2530218 RepID=UPI00244DBD7D|nr:zinc finger protein OZF-like [Condylostylus longicornis]
MDELNSFLKKELKLKCGEIYLNKKESNKIILTCIICELQFESLEHFSTHIVNEHFTCDFEAQFSNSSNDSENINNLKCKCFLNERSRDNKVNNCRAFLKTEYEISAEEKFIDKQNFELDLKEDSNKTKKVRYKKGFGKVLEKSLKKSFKCPICPEYFEIEDKIEHMKKHEHFKRFICELCGKGFQKNYELVRHMNTHGGERSFKCELCSATFYSKIILTRHEMTHLNYKPFKCNVCQALFKLKRSLQLHEAKHKFSISKDAGFECDVCQKKFSSNINLTAHRSRHKAEKKQFECSKCPRSFTLKYDCTSHERLEHKGEYNYKCRFCDKTFIKCSKKNYHEESHTRVGQPFSCDLCPNKYATKQGLYKHKKRNHISNKPSPDLKCHKCDKTFKFQNEYSEHCRKHVLEKYQFVCFDCGANFVNEINLKNHMNVVHSTLNKI